MSIRNLDPGECKFQYIVSGIEKLPMPITTNEPIHIGEILKIGEKFKEWYEVISIEHYQAVEMRETPKNKVSYRHLINAGTFVKVVPLEVG
jgi:hypothetical protein